MLHGGAEVYDSSGDFQWCIPYISNGSAWQYAIPYVYSGSWKLVGGGGVPYDYYLDKNGNYVLVNGGGYFLVPRVYIYLKLKESTTLQLVSSDGFQLQVRGEE